MICKILAKDKALIRQVLVVLAIFYFPGFRYHIMMSP